jgi:hypothetical protein
MWREEKPTGHDRERSKGDERKCIQNDGELLELTKALGHMEVMRTRKVLFQEWSECQKRQ